MENEVFYSIILRHDTSTQWMISNPILALGEYGVEDDTHRVKRGDGESKWSDLLYEDFGLSYIITYENLTGDVKDNQALTKALDEKIDKATFEDVSNQVVSSINIVSGEDIVGKITKITKDVVTGITSKSVLVIKSADHSVQGYWEIDENGVEVLDLRANSAIEDFTPGHAYYTEQLCYYNNKLYRALVNFTATKDFIEDQWLLIASLSSDDIKFNNKVSGLESTTVKKAIDELADMVNNKVQQTRHGHKIYGTSEDGEQMTYDKDDLRTVDSVNGVEANNGTKNIQIDAKKINVDDNAETKQTIKEGLDSKVDKNVAGEGGTILKNFSMTYDENTGDIVVNKTNLSLETGELNNSREQINVASNTELTKVRTELDTKINNTEDALNTKVENTEASLRETINSEVGTLNNSITLNIAEVNQTIENEVATLNTAIAGHVENINKTIDENKTEIEQKLLTAEQILDNKILSQGTVLNNKIDANKEACDKALSDGLNTKIDKDIADSILTDISVSTESFEPTLKITAKNTDTETEVVKHIHFKKKGSIVTTKDTDHIVIDSTAIDTALAEHTQHLGVVDTRLASQDSILQTINDDLDIHSEHLATIDAELAEVDKTLSEHQLHLETTDNTVKALNTKHENDVTDLKAVDAKQATQILDIETQLDVIGEQLQAQSDTIVSVTDEVRANEANIATNATNIAKNTQDIATNTASIADNNRNIGKNAEEITENRMAIDENLQAIIRNDIAIQANLQAIQANDTDIANLQAEKADKTFASATDNKVVGSLKLSTIANNEILVLDNKSVNPADGTSSESKIKVISSDNTVVAKTVLDDAGNVTAIDLATNLDIDVHYFYTSATLNKTIPSENTISFDSLTNTTAPTEIQVKDIVSDADGTWARVQEVDSANKTIKCVTFHNQTRAVWGSIDGTLADQQDLKAALDDKLDKTGLSQVATNAKLEPIGSGYGSIQGLAFHLNYYDTVNKKANSFTKQLEILATNSVEFFRKTATNPNIVQFNVLSEGVTFDAKESGLTSTLLAPAIRELKTLDDGKVLITDFNEFKTAYETYKASVTKSLEDLESTIDGKLANLEADVTNTITPKLTELETSISELETSVNNTISTKISELETAITEVETNVNSTITTQINTLDNSVVKKVTTAGIVYGTDASGNPTTYKQTDFGKVDTINGVEADNNKGIIITAENIDYVQAEGNITIQEAISANTEELAYINQVLQATQLVWSMEVIGEMENPPIKNFDFLTATSSNGVVLMAQIRNIENLPNPAEYSSYVDFFKAGVEVDALEIVGIPEQLANATVNCVMAVSAISNVWTDMTASAKFEVYGPDSIVLASRTLKASDVEMTTYNNADHLKYKIELADGQTPETLQANAGGLKVTTTVDGEEVSQTYQFNYDADANLYWSDVWQN